MNKIPENQTVMDLVKRAREEHQKKEKEVQRLEEENRQKIISLVESEKKLKGKIEAGKKRISEMENEFEELEKDRMKANLEEIRKSELTRDDVSSGKSSVHEFYMKGKQDDEIKKMTEAKTLEDLEETSDMIRVKRSELVELEIELCNIQNEIFGLVIYPGKLLKEKYKELSEWLDYTLNPLREDWNSARSTKIQKEHELNLIKTGIGLSGGYRWDNISKKEARRLIHNPILPKEHTFSLLEQLDEIEEGKLVSVSYHHKESYWPGLAVEVHQSFEPEEIIKSEQLIKKERQK